jgi:DNA-binding NarL/FixJ family response regulator
MARIIIADDHGVFREGLKALLGGLEGLQVIAEASDGLELIPLVEKHSPDLVIVDLAMPNLGGVEAIARLQRLKNKPAILVLSAREDDLAVNEAVRAGAKGYVPKSSSSDELQFAIKALLKGQAYISPVVASGLINKGEGGQDAGSSPLSSLTVREREVMKLLCEGHPNRDVAKVLHVSARTIDSHRANIMKKLGINSNAEMTQIAIKYGLIE